MREKHIPALIHYYTACQKNYQVLREMSERLQTVFEKDYGSLTFEERLLVDAFLHRVTLLQEFLEKLLRTYLKFKGYRVGSMTPIDVLNTAEKLELVSSGEDWFNLEDMRNRIVHQYTSDEEELNSLLKDIYREHHKLLEIYERIEEKLKEEGIFSS